MSLLCGSVCYVILLIIRYNIQICSILGIIYVLDQTPCFPCAKFKKNPELSPSPSGQQLDFLVQKEEAKDSFEFTTGYLVSRTSILFARILYLKLISKCAEIHSKQQHYVYISDLAPTGSLLKCFIHISLNVKKAYVICIANVLGSISVEFPYD